MNKEILERVKAFNAAMFSGNFAYLIDEFFLQDELQQFYDNVVWLAKNLEPFGENDTFIRLFPHADSLQDILSMPRDAFIAAFLKGAMEKLSQKKLQDLIDSVEVTHIEFLGDRAEVEYTFMNIYESAEEPIHNMMNLVREDGRWYVKFKEGMQQGMNVFRNRIQDFYDREDRDRPDRADAAEYPLEPFALHGYQNEYEEVVIEPRFSDAGDFCEGLAYVRAFSKYGYINQKGEFVIRPQFDRARDFWEGRAAVGRRNDELDMRYAFVDTTGQFITDYIYEEVGDFTEGLARVKYNGRWGFINTKGEVIIEIIYRTATDFEEGQASISRHTDDGMRMFVINTKGDIVASWDATEEE